jgi:AcrR family transcriptional regulator
MATAPNQHALRSQRARDQIVQAALTVFALKGYAAASMDDVCMAAGISKGGLYHHFETKGAVLSGVTERMADLGALFPPFDAAMGATSLSHDALGRVLIEIWAEASRDDSLRDRLRAGYEARLDESLRTASGDSPIGQILRIGALIQMLSQNAAPDTAAAARRLGIDRAA